MVTARPRLVTARDGRLHPSRDSGSILYDSRKAEYGSTAQHRKDGLLVRAFAFVVLLSVVVGCGDSAADTATATPRRAQQPATKDSYSVEYTLTFERAVPGTRANWTNASGGNERESDLMSLRRTWEYTMAPGAHAYLSASTGRDAQRVECTITIEGVDVDSTYADGSHATATCSAIVGR